MITWKQGSFLLQAWDRDIQCSCIVKRLEDGTRPPWMVVRTMPNDKPYSPVLFPVGAWRVGRPVKRDDDYRKPFFIPTTAYAEVPVWEVKERVYHRATEETDLDYGYGLHCSTSRTTLGCIKIIEQEDLLWMVARINEELDKGDFIDMEVTA